jgi:hypothetical protein
MTTLQLKLTLPQDLAKQAKAAGLLEPEAIKSMCENSYAARRARNYKR